MKNYIGKKCKGFKFENNLDGVSWYDRKKDFIGKIGKIIKQEEKYVVVFFEDDGFQDFAYPISMIEEHLLPFELELPKKGDRILVSDDEEKWEERIFLNYIEELLYPILCIPLYEEDDFKNGEKVRICLWKHWKPIPEKIKLTKQEIAYKFGINLEQLEITE